MLKSAYVLYQSKKISNAFKIESALHKQYKECAIGKEWFIFEDIDSVIKNIEFLVTELGEECIENEENVEMNHLVRKLFGDIQKEVEDMKRENDMVERFLYCVLGISQDSEYTDLIYKSIFGKNANQLREEFGIGKKDSLRDAFSAEDLRLIQSMECLVSGLVDCGWGYDQIKNFIQENSVKRIAA